MQIYRLSRNWLSDVRLTVPVFLVFCCYYSVLSQSLPDFNIQEKGCVGEIIEIFNTTQISPGDTLNYTWEISDPNLITYNTKDVSHIWSRIGTFTVKLIIENQEGDTSQISKSIAIKAIPQSNFTYDLACETVPVNFTAQNYPFDSFGTVTYLWSIEDSILNEKHPSYIFDNQGIQVVTLEVLSDHGCSDTFSRTLDVNKFVEADFEAKDVCEGDEVCFRNLSLDTTINYRWAFGDGAASSDFNGCHAFAGPGVYTVVLNTFFQGCNDEIAKQVTVYSGFDCPSSRIFGNVYHDTSTNCDDDIANRGPSLQRIKIQAYINNELKSQTYTNAQGNFGFSASKGDSVRLQINEHKYYNFDVSCPPSGIRSMVVTAIDSAFSDQNFGIKCIDGDSLLDLSVHSIQGTFRPARSRPVIIFAGERNLYFNLFCADSISGTVTTVIDGSASYVSPHPWAHTPTSVTGDGKTLTYDVRDFGSINNKRNFSIILKTDSNAKIGSDICIKTIISTNANDINSGNDTLLFCGRVVNSYDPNDKQAYPAEITTPDSWITYTIRYQNTGTDTAYDIYIEDTLSRFIDESTFTYLNGSVRPEITLNEKAILFDLPGINLLDSFSNEPESHGWLQYKVKTKADLDYNDVIENTAYIYFDQNEPVVTNTTENRYLEPITSVQDKNLNIKFRVYPNPTKGKVTIEFDQNKTSIAARLLSYTGKEIETKKVSSTSELNLNLEVPSGLYFLEVTTDNGNKSVVKVLKH